MNRVIYAPFDPRQVELLNEHQAGSRPFLCAEHGWKGVLVASPGGWFCPVNFCEFIQLWAFGSQLIPARSRGRSRRRGE